MNLLNTFSNTQYDNLRRVRNDILNIVQLTNIFREVTLPITDDFFVHQVLSSLSIQCEQLKISSIALRDKQSINELISVSPKQEKTMSLKKVERAHLIVVILRKKCNNHNKKFNFQRKTTRMANITLLAHIVVKTKDLKAGGHVTFVKKKATKADCHKFKAQMDCENKQDGILTFESHQLMRP